MRLSGAVVSGAVTVMVVVALCACGEKPPTSPPPPMGAPTLRIVAGGALTDTIDATPPQAVVVALLDGAKKPMADVPVTLAALDTSGACTVLLRAGADTSASPAVTLRTGADGQVSARLVFCRRPGAWRVLASSPSVAGADTGRYTVTAGWPGRATLLPHDTVILVGQRFTYRMTLMDRAGNVVGGLPLLTDSGPAARVDAAGGVTGVDIGRSEVVASVIPGLVSSRDWAHVTVLPAEELVLDSSDVLVRMYFDGSGRRVVSRELARTPSWSADGSRFVALGAGKLIVMREDGSITYVSVPDSARLAGIAFPRYSPDGQWIHFNAYDRWYFAYAYRIHEDGTGFERVVPEQAANVAFSPDGRRMAYVTWVQGGRLWVRDLAAGTATQPLPGRYATFPSWSADGSLLLLLTSDTAFVAAADGTSPKPLMRALDVGASWGPKGPWFIASSVSIYPCSPDKMMLVNAQTGEQIALPRVLGCAASWRPKS